MANSQLPYFRASEESVTSLTATLSFLISLIKILFHSEASAAGCDAQDDSIFPVSQISHKNKTFETCTIEKYYTQQSNKFKYKNLLEL